MASFAVVLLMVSLLVATSSAAPKNTKLSIQIPEECKGGGFCSIKPKGYDEYMKEVNRLLPPYLMNVGNRIGPGQPLIPESDNEDNCPHEVMRERPFSYRDLRNMKLDVIVQTYLVSQIVVRVKCKNNVIGNRNEESSPKCFKKLRLEDFGMDPICEETHGNMTLLVYDPEDPHFPVKTKSYEVPVSCSCHIYSKN